ncbi:MAG TPA: helix-turn-helix transcriptional regulator [Polyangia bacterium]|nr:helix-turn-helix transcriptional regulator [Polyangia bacterium]
MKIGSPRDEREELFDELGEIHELRAGVQKKVLAHDIKRAMKAKKISPSEMARRMRTSREAVYRLLDPTRTGVTLDSLQRAASALGLTLNISFEPPARRPAATRQGSAARRKRRAGRLTLRGRSRRWPGRRGSCRRTARPRSCRGSC